MSATRPPDFRAKKPTPGRRRWRVRAVVGASLLVLVVLAAWYLNSGLFRRHLRSVVVARLERVTGGRVELGALRWQLWRLEIDAEDLTIHGTEPAGEAPLLHASRVHLHLKPLAFFSPHLGLRELEITTPRVHLIVSANGESNLPGPRAHRSAEEEVGQIIDMSIERVAISDGSLQWNERIVRLEFSGSDVVASTRWDAAQHRYVASVHLGRVGVHVENARPLALAADAEFTLYRNHLDVSTLRLSSAGSRLELSGTLDGFQAPSLAGRYRATLHLGEIAAALREPRVRGGTAEIDGLVARSLKGWASSGKVTLRDFAYDDGALHLEGVNGETSFLADAQQLRLPQVLMHLLGGEAAGELEAKHWLAGADAPPALRPSGKAHLQAQGLRLEEVLRALDTPDLPLAQLHLSARTSGTVEMHWQGTPRNGSAELDLETEPITSGVPGQVPVKLRLKGTGDFARGALEITELEAATAGTHLVATGRLSRDSSLKVSLQSTNVSELVPFARAVRGPKAPPLPFELAGSIDFSGTVTGTLLEPSVTGHGRADNMALVLPRSWFGPPGGGQAAVRIPWEHLEVDLAYSPWQVLVRSAKLRRGGTTLDLRGGLELENDRFLDTSRLHFEASWHNANTAELIGRLGWQYALSGTLDAHVTLAGPQNDLRGSVSAPAQRRGLGRALRFAGCRCQLRLRPGAVPSRAGARARRRAERARGLQLYEPRLRLPRPRLGPALGRVQRAEGTARAAGGKVAVRGQRYGDTAGAGAERHRPHHRTHRESSGDRRL